MKAKLAAATAFSVTLLLFLVPLRLSSQTATRSIQLKVGDSAPDFALEDQDGKSVSLHDFKGKNVILAFYVFSFSPDANQELKALNEDAGKLDGKAQVLAVSMDSVPVNHAFAETLGLKFLLLSDRAMKVGKQYGVYSPSGVTAENYNNSMAAWLIDASGRILSEHKGGGRLNFVDLITK
jgi:peroxiredoxin Q/BCP